jgi:hypothetical protein
MALQQNGLYLMAITFADGLYLIISRISRQLTGTSRDAVSEAVGLETRRIFSQLTIRNSDIKGFSMAWSAAINTTPVRLISAPEGERME